MDKLTAHIKILNEIYKDMKKSFDTLKKMFKKDSIIYPKIYLAEKMSEDIYRAIAEKMEKESINEEFVKIVKGIRNDRKRRIV